MKWKIPLMDPDLGAEEIRAVTRVLKSKWLTTGPVTAEFEAKFAKKWGLKHAIAVSNCTAALHLANLVLGVGPGDEVICPSLTFVATANAVRYTGARVVFADVVSPSDWTISPREIESKITSRTKAITVVHYAGFACRMDEILKIARKHSLAVIEDCAHSPLAVHRTPGAKPQLTGTLGQIGCFSFFANKNMTTGEGGMVTTNNDGLAEKVKLLRSHGMTTLSYERFKGHASGYDVVALGYNYRLDEIRSAIGLCQLAKIDRLTARRRQVTQWYREALKGKANVQMPFTDRLLRDSACHILPVYVQKDPGEVREKMKAAGIQTSRHYDLVSGFSIYGGKGRSKVLNPLHIVTLPLYPRMSRKNVASIARFFS